MSTYLKKFLVSANICIQKKLKSLPVRFRKFPHYFTVSVGFSQLVNHFTSKKKFRKMTSRMR